MAAQTKKMKKKILKKTKYLYGLLLLSILLFSFHIAQDYKGKTEQFAPGVQGVKKKMVLQLPFQPKPSEVTVDIIDNQIIFEGDIIVDKQTSLGWLNNLNPSSFQADPPQNQSSSEISQFNTPQNFADIRQDMQQLSDKINTKDINTIDLTQLDFPTDAEQWIDKKLAPDQNVFAAVAIKGSDYRWSNGIIPYAIDPNFTNAKRAEILEAIKRINNKTNLRLQARKNEFNYVRFITGNGCASSVGRQRYTSGQTIIVGQWCDIGAIVHEICHSAGLYHEHSRSDRDKYVNIQWGNIVRGMEHNFYKHTTDAFDIGSYNYESIMHYGPYAFTTNYSKPTITPKQSAIIGQRTTLSKGDIYAINQLYPKSPTTKPSPPSSSFVPDIIASVNRGDGKVYFFHENREYTRYNIAAFKPDLSYPRSIRNNWPNLRWTSFDASASWAINKVLLFKGNQCLLYDTELLATESGFPMSISDAFGLNWTDIDAACVKMGEKLYLFKDQYYVRYDLVTGSIDPGYPLRISDGWDGIPWTTVNAALNWNDQKFYLFNDDEYVRYDMKVGSVDLGYPKKVAGNWPGL